MGDVRSFDDLHDFCPVTCCLNIKKGVTRMSLDFYTSNYIKNRHFYL